MTGSFDDQLKKIASSGPVAFETFQGRVTDLIVECFGAELLENTLTFSAGLLEEISALVAHTGLRFADAQEAIEAGYNRDDAPLRVGVGKSMVVLTALSEGLRVSVTQAAEHELTVLLDQIEAIDE